MRRRPASSLGGDMPAQSKQEEDEDAAAAKDNRYRTLLLSVTEGVFISAVSMVIPARGPLVLRCAPPPGPDVTHGAQLVIRF